MLHNYMYSSNKVRIFIIIYSNFFFILPFLFAGLFQLGTHCKSLQRLDVSWCSAITEVGARNVLQGCHNLNHLGKVLEGLQNNYLNVNLYVKV